MRKSRIILTALLTTLLIGCAANRYENYTGIPKNHSMAHPETVLLVSTLGNKFYIAKGFSTNFYPFFAGHITTLSLATAKNEINKRDLRVIGSTYYPSNSVSINENLRDYLRQLNSHYHADYIIVILGAPRLSCPTAITIDHDRNVSPLVYTLSIEVLFGNSLEYVYSGQEDATLPQESTWGMVPQNYPLCVEIPAGRNNTAKRLGISAWLEQQTVPLIMQTMQRILYNRPSIKR